MSNETTDIFTPSFPAPCSPSIYETRIGFSFDAGAADGAKGKCVCSAPNRFLSTLSPDVLAQCCIAHPELLENAEVSDAGPGTGVRLTESRERPGVREH